VKLVGRVGFQPVGLPSLEREVGLRAVLHCLLQGAAGKPNYTPSAVVAVHFQRVVGRNRCFPANSAVILELKLATHLSVTWVGRRGRRGRERG